MYDSKKTREKTFLGKNDAQKLIKTKLKFLIDILFNI